MSTFWVGETAGPLASGHPFSTFIAHTRRTAHIIAPHFLLIFLEPNEPKIHTSCREVPEPEQAENFIGALSILKDFICKFAVFFG